MSCNITTKEIFCVEDCRQFNILECLGLIQHSCLFKDDFNDSIFKSMLNGKTKNYIFRCIPETKSVELTMTHTSFDIYTYRILFIPAGEDGIIIKGYTEENEMFFKVTYSTEELMDLFL